MEVKETGMSIRIPFIAEEKYIQKEYYNKKHQKLKTENIVEKELSTEFDVSASFVIGLVLVLIGMNLKQLLMTYSNKYI